MSGRWLINGVLLLILIGLGFLIRQELERARFVPLLTDLNPGDVYRIEVLRPGEPALVLTQTALGWRMEAPFPVDADNARVNQMLKVLESPVERSLPAQGAELRELGLAPPRLRLRADGRELQFGVTDPIGQARYVALEGLIHLIPDRFYHLLIAPPIHYVSPKLIPAGFVPIFGRLGETPLAAETLNVLAALHAERVEPLVEPFGGTPLTLTAEDGDGLGFVVSEDRRRWARSDLRLLYVLSEPIELALDPSLPDPFPQVRPWGEGQNAQGMQAVSPLQGSSPDDWPAAPPVIRLTPDGRALPVTEGELNPHAEPERHSPPGLGEDPFAPSPAGID